MTRRMAWAYRVVWGESGTLPEEIYLLEYNHLGQPIGNESGVKASTICTIGAGGARVRLPETVSVSVVSLAFLDHYLPISALAASVEYLSTMDDADARIALTTSGKLGESHDLKADLFSTFFIRPVWLDAGNDPVEPGECELVIQFKS
jgi:hypothetical protein